MTDCSTCTSISEAKTTDMSVSTGITDAAMTDTSTSMRTTEALRVSVYGVSPTGLRGLSLLAWPRGMRFHSDALAPGFMLVLFGSVFVVVGFCESGALPMGLRECISVLCASLRRLTWPSIACWPQGLRGYTSVALDVMTGLEATVWASYLWHCLQLVAIQSLLRSMCIGITGRTQWSSFVGICELGAWPAGL